MFYSFQIESEQNLDENEPILDYASPRKRTRLRLPARSIILVRPEQDEVVVEEKLQGKSEGIGGIVFACFVFVFVTCSTITNGELRKLDLASVLLVTLPLVAELAVLMAVVQQTWRRTVLTVRYDEVHLLSSSPLRRRSYRWRADDIADFIFVQTANVGWQHELGELLITRAAGGDIRLFTDHLALQLRPLTVSLPLLLRNGSTEPLETTEAPD